MATRRLLIGTIRFIQSFKRQLTRFRSTQRDICHKEISNLACQLDFEN
jgi:hypothetical protein